MDWSYTSLEPETAFAEYQQAMADPRPAVIVAARITLTSAVDFTGGYSTAWSSDWQDALNDWRLAVAVARASGAPPDTAGWRCGDSVVASGNAGLLAPSLQNPGGTNLIIYPGHLQFGVDKVVDLDPLSDIAAALAAIRR